MNKEFLLSICGDRFLRPNIAKPFSIGEFSYATQGHFLVRLKRLSDVVENKGAPNVEKILPPDFKPNEQYLFYSINKNILGKSEKCPCCKGYKRVKNCPDCDENYQVCFWTDSGVHYEMPCKKCDETGVLPAGENEDGQACVKCFCKGFVYQDSGTKIGSVWLSKYLLGALIDLPDLQICPQGKLDPVYFRFNCGDGVLMPMNIE